MSHSTQVYDDVETEVDEVFYVDLISLECTTSDDIEETQLVDLKNEDNRTGEVTIIDDDEPGVIACARGVPSCGVTPSTRGHLTMTCVVSFLLKRPFGPSRDPRRFQAPSQGSPTRLPAGHGFGEGRPRQDPYR